MSDTPTEGPFTSTETDTLTTTVNLDTGALEDIIDEKAAELRAEQAGWDSESVVEKNGDYRVGVDPYALDDVSAAVAEVVARRDAFDAPPSDIHIFSIHIEPGQPSYVEVYVDE